MPLQREQRTAESLKSTLILEAIQDDLQYRNPFVPADKDSGVGKGVRALRVEKTIAKVALSMTPHTLMLFKVVQILAMSSIQM